MKKPFSTFVDLPSGPLFQDFATWGAAEAHAREQDKRRGCLYVSVTEYDRRNGKVLRCEVIRHRAPVRA